jgi:diaminopimelate decarboxylase
MKSMQWWERNDLHYHNNNLQFAERQVQQLANQLETPCFIYNSKRVINNLQRLKSALNENGFKNKHKIFYAMKANRFAPLLTFLKTSGLCGIDACSPAEADLAISCGFGANEISYTGSSLSKADLQSLSMKSGLLMNCDSLHSIDSWGQLKPNSEIGIRINPAIGICRTNNEKLQYCGENITKFGIYREQFEQALQIAKKHGLKITRLHFHTGCGYLDAELEQLSNVLKASHWFIEQLPDLDMINIGGGLGVPHTETEKSLDLNKWAATIHKNLGQFDITLAVEPGEYIAKDAGLLLLETTYLEYKKDKLFLGVNAGFNLAPEPAYYDMPFLPVAMSTNGITQKLSIVGNINEALDVWYENLEFTVSDDMTHIAIINAGAYSSSMSSNHCMRGKFSEYLLF